MRSSCLIFILPFFPTVIFSQPNPRHLEEITYDIKRHKLILFGGSEMIPGGWIEPSSLHEWDGMSWKQFETQGPVGRRAHGWVYDEYNREVLLIGGVTKGKTIEDSVLFDVWTWNGSTWKLINTICPVKEPEIAYDPTGKKVLVYGDANNKTGINYNVKAAFELWEYSSGTWKKLSTDGPGLISSRKISFDIARNRLVIPVFDPTQMIVWEWTGKSWEKFVCENSYPVYRTRFALTYDAVEKQTFLFGGLTQERSQLGDFWKWDGKKWEKVENNDGPSVRNSAHFISCNDQLILYGGSVPKAPPEKGIVASNEIWTWKDGRWKLIK